MSEQEQTLENREQHRYGDDLLAPEQPSAEAVPPLDIRSGEQSEPPAQASPEPGGADPGPHDEHERDAEPPKPADPTRRLVRVGWALVAVTFILALVALSGWLRLTSSVNKVSCIERAQATFNAATSGGNVGAQQLGLARLGLGASLSKCG